jgi:hypothetical protein
MIKSEQYESIYAGLHYLRAFTKFGELWSSPLICSLTDRSTDKGGGMLQDRDAQGVIRYVVNALYVPHRTVQRIAAEILRFFLNKVGLPPPFFFWVTSAQRIYAH